MSMDNEHHGMGVEAIEIERADNINGMGYTAQDIDRLIVMITQSAGAPKTNNSGSQIPRTTPDDPYIQALEFNETHGIKTGGNPPINRGPISLGECAVCLNHDNEGFLCARENGMLTCGHPLCFVCAQHILTTTRSCPKCRRSVDNFIRVHIPSNS